VGVGAGALIAGFFLIRKTKQLSRRGDVLTRALEARGSNMELVLALLGQGAEARLAAVGRVEAEAVANRTAEEYLATHFGLTPARIEALSNLGS
jgi:hypothetical protein